MQDQRAGGDAGHEGGHGKGLRVQRSFVQCGLGLGLVRTSWHLSDRHRTARCPDPVRSGLRFSDTWQPVISTGTTIVTFLMVSLIRNSQNRDRRRSGSNRSS
ncbi:MAG: low affinity iron permease family protein [Tabrizicola sp.]